MREMTFRTSTSGRMCLLTGGSLHGPDAEQPATDKGASSSFVGGIVWGIQLEDSAAGLQVRNRLRGSWRPIRDVLRRSPTVHHVIVLYRRGPGHRPRSCKRFAYAAATDFHARAERELGWDVDVVFIDVTDCASHARLNARLLQYVRTHPSPNIWGALSLDWADVRDRSVHDVAAEIFA